MPAVSSWPFPQQPLVGLGISPEDNVVRTEVDAGPDLVRRRYTRRKRRFVASVVMPGATLKALVAWHRDTLKDGTLTFTWQDPVTDLDAELRFTGPPTYSIRVGGTADDRLWNVTLPLEVIPS